MLVPCPLQRCAAGFGPRRPDAPPCDPHKAFLTRRNIDAIQERAAKQPDRYKEDVKNGEAGRVFLAGIMDDFTPQRQTSLIMDPPDGKLPEMTPEGKRLSGLMKSSWPLPGEKLMFNSYKDFDSWDRCITRGLPASMFPFRYNNGLQIVQAPGYVALRMEMIHESRIIKLNAPPVSPNIKEWLGISNGHWDGNTLVVETTNFKPGASATNTGVMGSPAGNRFPISDQMKMTERFTRMNNRFSDLYDYGGRSRGAHAFLDRAVSVEARQRFPDIGICVYRRQQHDSSLDQRDTGGTGESRGAAEKEQH